jgi:crotonobetaine/carnitine-CoA ligase
VHHWSDLFAADPVDATGVMPSDLGTFIYTGGTTGLSKGCMLSHNYHEVLARQIGSCWGRTADDVVWTPLPLFHFNALVTAVIGPLIFGGRAAIDGKFSVSTFWRR